MHRPQRHIYKRLRTVPTGLNTDWQCDLSDFQNVASKNGGYRYLLVCIDVLSRKVVVSPTRSKTSRDMIRAFDEVFKKAGTKPTKLYSDQGLEFQAKQMQDYFARLGIQKRVMYSPGFHAGVVERAQRTIKGRLYRYFTQRNTVRWVDIIDTIVEDINGSLNRGLGQEPNSVTPENAQRLLRKLYKQPAHQASKPKFKVGDYVRIDKEKGVFGKYYLPNFTEELFQIAAVKQQTVPVHYKIVDLQGEEIRGVFYEPELSRTRLEPNQRLGEVLRERTTSKGVKEFLVRWIGEREKAEEWVSDVTAI